MAQTIPLRSPTFKPNSGSSQIIIPKISGCGYSKKQFNTTIHYDSTMRMPFETSSSKSESNTPKAIIFDWDDTICPSTFVDSYKVEAFVDFPMDVQRILHEVARSAERCLNEASKYGEVSPFRCRDTALFPDGCAGTTTMVEALGCARVFEFSATGCFVCPTGKEPFGLL